MKKSLNIQINFTNRAIYTLIAFGIFILAGVVVFAFGTSSPSTFGHSAAELDLSGGVPGDALFLGNVKTNGNLNVAGNMKTSGILDAVNGIKVGTSVTCGTSVEGTLRYNSASKNMGVCDGTNWAKMGGGSGGVSAQVFTASGTWTKPSGVTKVIVELIGGGGGGGSGTYLSDGGASNGATGGTSSFGSYISTLGGGGRIKGYVTKVGGGGAGGIASGSIINIDGASGNGRGGGKGIFKNQGSGGSGGRYQENGQDYSGGGGGAGAYEKQLIDVSGVSSVSVTVGKGGVGGSRGIYTGIDGTSGNKGINGLVIVWGY